MADFHIVGDIQPFLLVKMKPYDSIFSESNAMVSMDATIELKARMQGGFLSAMSRAFLNNESFFMQEYKTEQNVGDLLLAPQMLGGIKELYCNGNQQYFLNDGAFLACENGISFETKTQSISTALFGNSGGFFVMKSQGTGKLFTSALGETFELDVTPGNDIIVDNGHVVAWDSSLSYNISVSTSKGGFFSRALNSVLSGEGIVNRFSGRGKVYISSRNVKSFEKWINSIVSHPERSSNNSSFNIDH